MNSPTLLPVNATELEKALEQSQALSTTLLVKIKTLWNPQTCPPEFLPWLAWAFSVDHWSTEWPDQLKRDVIEQSVLVHREKGTVSSIERVLSVLGVTVELEEWFQFDGEPHTFKLTLWVNDNLIDQDILLSDELYRNLISSIDQVKPVRSHYDFKVGIGFLSTFQFAGAFTNFVYVPAQMTLTSDVNLNATAMDQSSSFKTLQVVQSQVTL